MTPPSAFLSSPLARCPRLFIRRAGLRLGLYSDKFPFNAPHTGQVRYPPHWEPSLRAWLSRVPLHPPTHPFNLVFGQEFDEELLLSLCREGPQRNTNGLLSDIKLPWDYSRAQPLFTNAACGPSTVEPCVAFLRRWIDANSDIDGLTWTCAMEPAIRAVNWVFADTLFAGQLGIRFGSEQWVDWLWRHGTVVWHRLEARLISSNHYLADLLALYVLGAIFPQETQAQRWRGFAEHEFPRELLAKTYADGTLNEASLRYHAFVTEMALLFRLAHGQAMPLRAENRLTQMCQVVADFRDATGDVFALGDDDSGRVLAVDSVSRMGRAEIILHLADSLLGTQFQSSPAANYPQGGWWVRRQGDFTVALEFGGVGMHGGGGHAHNDDLSFCLDWRGYSVIADPGTCLYTGDPAVRNQFRSTWYHNTVVVDGQEQRPLGDDVFVLRGSTRPFEARPAGPDAWVFERRIGPALVHRRQLTVRPELVLVRDTLAGTGRHKLDWRFHLHPSVQPRIKGQQFELALPQLGRITLAQTAPAAQSDPKLALALLPTQYSPGYGRRQPTAACGASVEAALPFEIEWQLRPAT